VREHVSATLNISVKIPSGRGYGDDITGDNGHDEDNAGLEQIDLYPTIKDYGNSMVTKW